MTTRLRPQVELTSPLGCVTPLAKLAHGNCWLTLRAVTPLDIGAYHGILSLPQVVEYDDFDVIGHGDATADIRGASALYSSAGATDSVEEFVLAVDLVRDGVDDDTAGFLYFTTVVKQGVRSLMIGYHLHPGYHGRGIARAAVGELVRKAMETKVKPLNRNQKAYHKYASVFALVYSGNVRSIHLLEALGFIRVEDGGTVRDVRGTPMVEHRYVLENSRY